MVRETITSQIRDAIARQEGEWCVADIRDMVGGTNASKVLIVIFKLMAEGSVERIGYSRGPCGHARPTYMTTGEVGDSSEPPVTNPEEILAGLMGNLRYEDVRLKVTGRFKA
jgi:hypothetical protein